ncbi:MAG: hypothetical protein KC503_41065 [Myxococcales bacterium]|nr:hypothetical protein [Myxococcales bacterium]
MIALLIGARDALAGPSGDYLKAKQLVQRAEAMEQLSRQADVDTLLRYALAAQRDKAGREYGYARYVHFMLARRAFRAGDKRKARRELQSALAIKAGQQDVDERHRVSRRHPFIINNFPKLAGVSTKRRKRSRIFSAAKRLIYVGGDFVYGVAQRALYRLDRKRRTVLTVHMANETIENVAVHASHKRFLLTYEGSRRLHYINLQPLEEARIKVPFRLGRVFLDGSGREAIAYVKPAPAGQRARARGRHGRVAVYSVALYGKQDARPLFRLPPEAKLLWGGARQLLYVTRDHGSLGAVKLRQLDSGRETRLFAFSRGDQRSTMHVVASRDEKRLALFVRDTGHNKRYAVLVTDLDKPTRLSHAHGLALRWPSQLTAAWSNGGRLLLLLAKRGKKLDLVAMNAVAGSIARVSEIPARGAPIGAIGTLKGDGRVFVLRGLTLRVMRLDGRARDNKLRRLSGQRGASYPGDVLWLGETPPEQLLIKYIRGKVETYALVPVKKVRAP